MPTRILQITYFFLPFLLLLLENGVTSKVVKPSLIPTRISLLVASRAAEKVLATVVVLAGSMPLRNIVVRVVLSEVWYSGLLSSILRSLRFNAKVATVSASWVRNIYPFPKWKRSDLGSLIFFDDDNDNHNWVGGEEEREGGGGLLVLCSLEIAVFAHCIQHAARVLMLGASNTVNNKNKLRNFGEK